MSAVLEDVREVRSQTTTDRTRSAYVLAATTLASSLALIDSSIVNVSLPAIVSSFPAGFDQIQWVIGAYLLPLSALLLLGGAAGDRFGRRRMFIGGIGLFALASIFCALAPGMTWLLGSRFLQGVSAAILIPNSLAILGHRFSGQSKGRAIGIWASTGAIAGAIGPVLGGSLVDNFGWPSAFLINVPVALAAMALAIFSLEPEEGMKGETIDWPGAAIATAALGIATWAMTNGSGHGWTRNEFAALASSVLLLVLFLGVEQRRGSSAMMPLSLFGSGSFSALTLFTFLLYGVLGGFSVLMPFFLIRAESYTATQAGAALLPLPVMVAFVSPVAGALAGKIGYRGLLIAGSGIVGLGLLLVLRIGNGAGYVGEVLPAVLVVALGMACAIAPLTTAVLSSVDAHHIGAASGLNGAVARTGGLIAVALLGSVLATQGPLLASAFGAAATIGAALCLAGSLSVLLIVKDA